MSELREAIDNALRTMSIKLTVPAMMTGKVSENLYDVETECFNAIIDAILEALPFIYRDDTISQPHYIVGRESYQAEVMNILQAAKGKL